MGLKQTKKKKTSKTAVSGGSIAFRKAVLNGVREEMKKGIKTTPIHLNSKVNQAVRVARSLVKKAGGRRKIRVPRTIPIPKHGGVLPFLVPLFAGLSAIGGLTGGVSGVVRAVNASQEAKKKLIEAQRHNRTMEAIAIGKQKSVDGSGLYLKPYRKGMGLYLRHPTKNLK